MKLLKLNGGGTRHSSTLALLDHATPEQIRRATMHSTNKAFERYYRVTKSEVESIYNATQVKEFPQSTGSKKSN